MGVARLQGCKVARLQDCKVARLQGCKAVLLSSCEVARLQGCKVARLQPQPLSVLSTPPIGRQNRGKKSKKILIWTWVFGASWARDLASAYSLPIASQKPGVVFSLAI